MTTGNIMKKISLFALPCILSRLLQNLFTLADSAVVGKAADLNALAAVGATASIVTLFTETIMGLMSGFSVTAAKKYGCENSAGVKKVFANSLIVTFIVSVAITVFGTLSAGKMLSLMGTPPEIAGAAEGYLKIIFLGMSATVFYNFLCEMLRALGNSRQPLIFLSISSVIHIALLVLFTFSFKMSTAGAALSTVLSQLLAVMMSAAYIHRKTDAYKISKSDLRIDKAVLKECLHIGIPMALTNFVVMFGVIILSFVTNKIGTEYVAGYSSASRIGYMITTPIFGFATAAQVFVSQNLGAGNFARIKEGLRKTNILVTIINVVLLVIFLFASRPILSFMLNDDKLAVNAGVTYLYIRCTAMFALTFAAIYKASLAALGKTFFPTLSGFLEIAARYAIPITLSQSAGFLSVPLTDAFVWLMLAALLTPAYIYEFKKISSKGQTADVPHL